MPLIAQTLSDATSTQDRFIITGVVILVAALIYWLAVSAGRRYVQRMTEKGDDRGARAATLWAVLRRVIMLTIVATSALFLFTIWGYGIGPFLGVGAVVGAAIGFGAQDLVKDLLAGFFILMEDQFHVGDTVTIAGTSGTVEDIQLRVTVLRDLEGNVHFVPNGQITVTSNFTSKYAQPVIDIGVAYETDVDRAMEVLGDELTKLTQDPEFSPMISGEPEVLGVNDLADSAVILRARLTTDADSRWLVRREALRRIKKRFDSEGISIPFPQVTINQKE